VHQCLWPMLGQQISDQIGIGDVAAHKHMARVISQRGQIAQVTCVGEFVQIDQLQVGILAQNRMNEITAYKACPAGDQHATGGE